jgi:hypothetical protein
MYFALQIYQHHDVVISTYENLPFRWIAFLLDLCEYTFRLVVLTMCTRRHLAITFDLLLPTHVASL